MDPKAQAVMVVIGVAILLSGSSARAEQATPPPTTVSNQQDALNADERRIAVNGALSRISDPTLRSVVSGPTPTFVLEAGATSKTAAARIGIQYRDVLIDLKLQGLVDSTTGQAVLTDLGGLRNKSTAEFGILWTSYPRQISQRVLDAACASYRSTARPAIGIGECTMTALRAATERRKSSAPGESSEDPTDSVIRLLEPRRLWLAGMSYRVGPERFSFSSTPTADATSVGRLNWSASARAGVVTGPTMSVGAEYLYEVEYEAAGRRQICEPIGGGVLECSDKVVGLPTGRHRNVARVEIRKFLSSSLAINPRVSVNLATATIGVDVPVYFLQSNKGGLAGGVTIGWRHSAEAGATVEISAFVGQVFGVILK